MEEKLSKDYLYFKVYTEDSRQGCQYIEHKYTVECTHTFVAMGVETQAPCTRQYTKVPLIEQYTNFEEKNNCK